jgi:tetratricopeptide (TPR) repeat protein/tRNA A-37 threonylcarbamoyl transferase component Bud32
MSDSTSARSGAADRNLLFGILAVQNNFVGNDALITAMKAWLLDKSKPLGQILIEQGHLTAERCRLLDALVQEHIRANHDNLDQSLASVSKPSAAAPDTGDGAKGEPKPSQAARNALLADLIERLKGFDDSELNASLGCISASEVGEISTILTRPASADEAATFGPRYWRLQLHAEGGLGKVFVAFDQEMHREVALKEMRPEQAGNADSRGRFILEAEITGRLEHPGIVPVHGQGQYADGRPYYAMRFIKGETLREAISHFHQADQPGRDPGERSLALRQLLGQFVAVCNTTAYAHSRGIIHRDIKPGNIMLGKFGETLVLDWGLAKVVGRSQSDADTSELTLRPFSGGNVEATQPGSAVGTPPYMSPEQAAGRWDQVGPASDIYSLGATLYTLLTDQAPFPGSNRVEVVEQVKRGTFVPPRQLRKQTPRSLEAICMKAMAREPAARYATVLELAADVEHWLADEPVTAYPEPWVVRASRSSRRHKAVVAALLAAALVAGVLGVTAAWWLDRQRGQLRRAVETDLSEVARLQGQSHWAEARAALGRASARLGDGGPEDLLVRLEQARQDLDLVSRLDGIRLDRAIIVEGKVDFAGADRGYMAAFIAAGLGMADEDVQAVAARVRDSAVRGAIVGGLDDWAICTPDRTRRNWLLQIARFADPDPWRDRARNSATWEDPAALERLVAEEAAMGQSAQLIVALSIQVERTHGSALKFLQQAQAEHPNDFWLNLSLANLTLKSDPKEAIAYYRAALAVRSDASVVCHNLGLALHNLRRLKEAKAQYAKAIKLDPKYAYPHNNLGNILRIQGRHDEAKAHYKKASELDSKFAAPHNGLGNVLRTEGRLEDAEAEYAKAIQLDPKVAIFHNNRGVVLGDQHRWEEAKACYAEAINLDPKDPDPPFNLGLILHNEGRLTQAKQKYRQAEVLGLKEATEQIRLCDRQTALARRLPALLKGDDKPTSAAERLEFADLCLQPFQRHYLAAARLSAEAFAADPKLADDLKTGHRYNAAFAAALAVAGQGKDAANLDDKERTGLRRQALDWLRADLVLWAKSLDGNLPQARATVQEKLRHWQRDRDLASLRDATALAKLPATEREACLKLWAEVEELLKRAGAGTEPKK